MKTKDAAVGDVSWKSFASAIEHCSSVNAAVIVLEEMLVAVRAAPRAPKVDSNLGHFVDWLREVRAHGGTADAATRARLLEVFGALTAASSTPPAAVDVGRLHELLAAMREP